MRKLLIDLENVLLNGNGHSDVYQNEPVADAREVLNSWKKNFDVVIFSSDVLKSSNWLNKYNLPHDIVISSDSKKGYEGNFLIDSDVESLSRFSGIPVCFAKPENKLYGGAKIGSLKEAEFAVRVFDSYRN
jgi:5'(3')-deoxyribonucleotidase